MSLYFDKYPTPAPRGGSVLITAAVFKFGGPIGYDELWTSHIGSHVMIWQCPLTSVPTDDAAPNIPLPSAAAHLPRLPWIFLGTRVILKQNMLGRRVKCNGKYATINVVLFLYKAFNLVWLILNISEEKKSRTLFHVWQQQNSTTHFIEHSCA